MVLEDAKKWNQQIFQPHIITRSSLSFDTAPPNKHASCIGLKNEQNYYCIAVSVWLSIARAMGLPWLVCGFDSFPVENLASSHWRWSFQGWTSPILFETTNQLVLSTNKPCPLSKTNGQVTPQQMACLGYSQSWDTSKSSKSYCWSYTTTEKIV